MFFQEHIIVTHADLEDQAQSISIQKTQEKTAVVPTGDPTHSWPWVATVAVAFLFVMLLVRWKQKER
ncbi:hypothetical protein ACTQW9_07440 [Lachnospiraceae bacterium LCP19S3_B12]